MKPDASMTAEQVMARMPGLNARFFWSGHCAAWAGLAPKQPSPDFEATEAYQAWRMGYDHAIARGAGKRTPSLSELLARFAS